MESRKAGQLGLIPPVTADSDVKIDLAGRFVKKSKTKLDAFIPKVGLRIKNSTKDSLLASIRLNKLGFVF